MALDNFWCFRGLTQIESDLLNTLKQLTSLHNNSESIY